MAAKTLPRLQWALRGASRRQTIAIARAAPQAHARFLSGPYGYTQTKTLVFSEYGQPQDVLKLHTHSISPSLPSNTLLLRTLASPINPADINTIQGTYGIKPRFTTDLGTQPPAAIPGNEAVFEVIRTTCPEEFKVGDWVLPLKGSMGTWRTHLVCPKTDVFKIDQGVEGKDALTISQAATVAVNPCSAYWMLRAYGPTATGSRGGDPSLGGLPVGQPMSPFERGSGGWVIQNGANSAVGRAVIQLAKLWGLRTINIIRDRDDPKETDSLVSGLKSLGADHVIPESTFLTRSFTNSQLPEILAKEPLTLALNCVGGQSATQLSRCLSLHGTLVSYGGMSRRPLNLPVGLLIFKNIRCMGFWLSMFNQRAPEGKKAAVNEILGLTRAGLFRDSPVEEVEWNWDSKTEGLRDAVARGLEGRRGKKGIFIFKDT